MLTDLLVMGAVMAGAFGATNLDNLVLLVALYARYDDRPTLVAAGYVGGMLMVGLIAFIVGKIAGNAPVEYLGLLGVVPVGIGVWSLVRRLRPAAGSTAADADTDGAALAATITTQLSNGTDTVITFSILFADSSEAGDYLVALTFCGMLCVFAATALAAARHDRLRRPIARYGSYVTPFILIGVGLYVLSNTALDVMPGS